MAYAVRRPVENLYLVRERDRQRTRELVVLALAAVPPAVVLFLAIWANLETVRLGYQLATSRRTARRCSRGSTASRWTARRPPRSRASSPSRAARSGSCRPRSTRSSS